MANGDWKRVVQEKRLQRERAIAEFQARLGPVLENATPVNQIDDIEVLTSKISNGELTSEDVTTAYIARYLLVTENMSLSA
jgi:hypothetical protein